MTYRINNNTNQDKEYYQGHPSTDWTLKYNTKWHLVTVEHGTCLDCKTDLSDNFKEVIEAGKPSYQLGPVLFSLSFCLLESTDNICLSPSSIVDAFVSLQTPKLKFFRKNLKKCFILNLGSLHTLALSSVGILSLTNMFHGRYFIMLQHTQSI